MITMDKIDSFAGWLVNKGYGSLVFCAIIVGMLFFFQRHSDREREVFQTQVDSEQSRILAGAIESLANTKLALEAVTSGQHALNQAINTNNARDDRQEDRMDRIDDFGPRFELQRRNGTKP